MYLFIVFAYTHKHIYIICRCIQVYPGWYIPQFWWIDDNWPLWKSKDHRTSRPLLEYKPPKPVSSWLATTEWMLLLTRSVAKNRIWQWPMSCRHNVSKDGKEHVRKTWPFKGKSAESTPYSGVKTMVSLRCITVLSRKPVDQLLAPHCPDSRSLQKLSTPPFQLFPTLDWCEKMARKRGQRLGPWNQRS